MSEFLSNLLIAVITAAVPVLTTYAVKLIKQVGASAAAKTDDAKKQGYANEIALAVSEAVSMVSQTYVDSLKNCCARVYGKRVRRHHRVSDHED